jgi:AraC-like DNA-binding protein
VPFAERQIIKMNSEQITNEEIGLNSCGIQTLFDHDYHVVRSRIDYTLMYISSGKASVIIEGKMHNVHSGDAMLFLPNSKQEYTFLSKDKAINQWIHFSGTICSKLGETPIQIVHINNREDFENEFNSLINSYYGLSEERDLLCNGHLTVLLAKYLESCKTELNPITISEQRMTDVLNYIQNNICGDIDWNICAEICCLGRDRFNHVFKAKIGVSPNQYHKLLRIKYAKKMLSNVGITVNECAEALGYSDTNYFCRIFKKETGLTPLAYKKTSTVHQKD